MLNETVLYLLIIGLASLFKTQKRYDFLLSFFITFFCFLVAYFFLLDWKVGTETFNTFILDNTHSANIRLDIVSSMQNYVMIYPFVVMTLAALINNLFFKYEAFKKSQSALFVFNLFAFVMLIAGNNLIQLITFVFMIDILSQLFIQNTRAARRYGLYNFVADMCLFLVLAMIEGKIINLDVGNISRYYETGHHRDFIVFVIMISLAIKFGFFLFQGYWLDLKNAKFHNLYFLPCLSTPMAALILFIKFYPILVVSPSFLPTLNIMVFLTMLWGGTGAVFARQIKEKFVYFNMMNIALLAKLIEQTNFLWNIHFSNIIILFFMFNLCFYYLHFEIDRGCAENKLAVCLVGLGFLADISSLTTQIFSLCGKQDAYWFYAYLGFYGLSLASVFAQIYRGVLNHLTQIKANTTVFLMAIVLLTSVWLGNWKIENTWQIWFMWLGVFIFFYFTPAYISPYTGYFRGNFNNIDILGFLYQKAFKMPIRRAGALCNILVDFVFLERTFLPFFSVINTAIVRTYRKMSRYGFLYGAICIVFGIVLVAFLCFGAAENVK